MQSLELPKFIWFALKASLMFTLQILGGKLFFEVLFGSGFHHPILAPLDLGLAELPLGLLCIALFVVGLLLVLFDSIVAALYWDDRDKLGERSLSLRGDKPVDIRENLVFRFFFLQSFVFILTLAFIDGHAEGYKHE